jgi:hypothetical protein
MDGDRVIDRNVVPSLLDGHRSRAMFSEARVPIEIAPEVRERLNNLLYSPHFMGTGVGFSAFIDRACEAAETEIALRAGAEGRTTR